MKILLVIENHYPSYGGPYTVVSQTAKYLFLNNIDFKIIFRSNSNINYKHYFPEIIKDFDIVHIFGIWQPWLAKVFYIAKKLKKKIIISPLGALEPWSLQQKKMKKKMAWIVYQKKILEKADLIHATSLEEKKHVEELKVKTQIKVLPHGIEIQQKNYIRNNSLKKAIFFSRIHEKKGLLELVQSWKELDHLGWILEIYGPVSNKNYLFLVKKKIDELNLYKKVKILEPVYNKKKKEQILSNADLFILPSKSENFGMSIGEAMSFGIPVLTTTATPWLIINRYQAGKIFEFSQKNLTESLKNILDLPAAELSRMGANAKKLVEENYNFSKIIKQYIKLYRETLAQ